jgi:TRAP-type C4-dicarboxylate transport system substrate-binding protein
MNYNKDKPIELVFHNIHDHGTQIMDLWISEVVKRTGGRVSIRKTSGEDRDAILAADIVRDVPAGDERYHLLNLVQIPFVFPGSLVGSRVIAQLYAEFPELRSELSDVKVLGLGIGAMMAIFSGKAWGPIRTLEDLKGARTRSLPPIDRVLEAFGARPLHVGWFEIPRLLEAGDLDAAVLGVLPGHQFKLADGAAPYCTLTGEFSVTMHPMRISMKWDAWNRLPADVGRIIEEIGPSGADCWFAARNGVDSDGALGTALDYIRQHGELITIDGVELHRWRRLAQPEREAAVSAVEARGLPGRSFFNRMMELVAGLS